MKHIIQSNNRLLPLMVALGLTTAGQAGMRVFEPMFDPMEMDNVFEDFEQTYQQMQERMEGIKTQLFGRGPSKEEHEAMKASREALSKIKAKVESDKDHVFVRFNLDGINKNDIKISKTPYGDISGSLPVKDGKVEFKINPHHIAIVRHIELKKEVKEEKADKADKDKKDQGKHEAYFYSSSAMEVKPFGETIDLDKAEASTKDNVLTIAFPKRKEALLQISHR